MSAATVGAEMPPHVTLDDLAAMAAADENHRYELSPDGVLSVMPPADPDHALLVIRIFAWFITNGYGPEQVVERDAANTVHLHTIRPGSNEYGPAAGGGSRPLAWLLSTVPDLS